MNKNEKVIMVVEKVNLFGNDYFQGFRPHREINYESRIISNLKWMQRGLAEKDLTHKQPIAYSVIINPALKKVFAYQRSKKDANYSEKRLQGKWSLGVGGHIEKLDTTKGNPVQTSMLRELAEEVHIAGSLTPKVVGYINDDGDEVGQVHFGILYIIETDAHTILPKAPEIESGGFRTIEELEKICSSPEYSVEKWAKITLGVLKSMGF